jgi:hypothetical protein
MAPMGWEAKGGAETLLPWQGGGRLITLAFVKKYLAENLVGIEMALYSLSNLLLNKEVRANELLPEEIKSRMREFLNFMTHHIPTLGLPMTEMGLRRFQEDLLDTYTGLQIGSAIEELAERFHDEMQTITFLYVKAEKLKYFEKESAFGAKVHEGFPSAEYDIQEAANCFALNRYTASVMHSMRVLESGLDAMAVALKVKRSGKSWAADLNVFKAAWDKKIAANPRLSGWRRQFFPKAFAEFRHFADAWRNHAMHAEARYGEQESELVFQHVQSFMQHLAARLHEPKRKKRT